MPKFRVAMAGATAALVTLAAAQYFTQAASVPSGSLIRGNSYSAVYWLGGDGKRYVFPNEATYKSWYGEDFSGVKWITDGELGSIPLGGNVTYRPGVRLVKITSDPKVYAVDAGGTLRWIATEQVAIDLYGTDWAKKVDDVPDAYFVNYVRGTDIVTTGDFSPTQATAAATDIGKDRSGSSQPQTNDGSTALDVHAIPMGDGKYASSAKAGYIYSCQTSFNGGGAFTTGDWVNGNTWDPSKKPTVDGDVAWPNASYMMSLSGGTRTLTSNALPKGHNTGTFPISSGDDAYSYDRNPNSISAQTVSVALPQNPTVNASPTCIGGEVGIAVTGVPIFNGFDAGGRDAVAHEIQDKCDGHPQESGVYHYHSGSGCVATGDGQLFGYAYDGFGIFSNLENGKSLTNADLDECHGHVGEVTWDGQKVTMYHYHLTKEFPYTVACYRGTPVKVTPTGGTGGQKGGQQQGSGMGGPGGGFPPPPQGGF